jgi:hypothetical protein
METFVEKLNSVNLEKELYMAFHEPLSDVELNALEKLVDMFTYDCDVAVSIKKPYTHEVTDVTKIWNEIRITGTLEKSAMKENSTPEGFDNQYRILVDDSNYVYFSIENIIEFGTMGINNKFNGGQHLVLGLRF